MSEKLDAILEAPNTPEKDESLKRVARFAATLSGKSFTEEYESLKKDAEIAVRDKAEREARAARELQMKDN
jgi:hypothetical protein